MNLPPSPPRLHAPATHRNREPLLAVLREVLPPLGTVLEIAAGTGEHAVFFASHLPHLRWIPSDPEPERRASIAAWAEDASLPNLDDPLDLDVMTPPWPVSEIDAILCINMIHIAPFTACLALLDGASRLLGPGAPVILYGPFQRQGRHTADSNAAFDHRLRGENPSWGVRNLETVEEEANGRGLNLHRVVEMPANNLTVVFHRSRTGMEAP